MPLQVGGVVDPTSTAFTVLPQASSIDPGLPGSVAAAGQLTVDEPFAGTLFSPPL